MHPWSHLVTIRLMATPGTGLVLDLVVDVVSAPSGTDEASVVLLDAVDGVAVDGGSWSWALVGQLPQLPRLVTLALSERQFFRDTHAARLVERLRVWVEPWRSDAAVVERAKSAFAQALGYLHRQWAALVVFLRKPEIEIHLADGGGVGLQRPLRGEGRASDPSRIADTATACTLCAMGRETEGPRFTPEVLQV